MKSSIFVRIFAGFCGIAIGLAVVISLISFRIIRTSHIGSLRSDLNKLALSLVHQLRDGIARPGAEGLDAHVKSLGRELGVRITVVAPTGSVQGDSEEDPAAMENHRTRPEVFKALSGAMGSSLRYSKTVRKDMLYVAVPVSAAGGVAGVVRVSLYLEDIDVLLASIRKTIILSVVAALLASLAAALLLARSVSRPIKILQGGAARIAAGDFTTRVVLKGDNEFTELGAGFNTMAGEIRTLVKSISRRQEELNAIITSLQEGLAVLDAEGRVVLFNPAFAALSGCAAPEGKHYWEVIRNPEFTSFIKAGFSEKRSMRQDIQLEGRTHMCSLTLLAARNAAVIVFHDITEIRRMEQVKKEFVSNVSHELRTPLTAIKGFVETLEGEVGIDQRHYVEVISRHTERLINIVRDLLQLSELEHGEAALQVEAVDLKELVEDTVQIFGPKAAEKKIALRTEIPDGLPPLQSDPFRLQQLLVNLVDNAVKYTEQGHIAVSVSHSNGTVVLTVEDTGIGIPSGHSDRIFERFYVVDKSRSRQSGGTGLGLSIVKHIVAQHRGTISLHSAAGEGTRVVVTLPA